MYMAIRDVREYFYTMLAQYLEEKQNLEDFATALKDDLITEEQMQDAIDNVANLEENYHRLAYIMYLFNLPNRAAKKTKYIRQHQPILDEFKRLGVDLDSIKEENADALKHFKAALKALKEKDE
jgi:hypothetical protein